MKKVNLFISVFLATTCYAFAGDQPKRAPSGFTGVRGKKSIPDGAYSDPSLVLEDNGQDEVTNAISDIDSTSRTMLGSSFEKRAPSGFLGMRGKKPYEEWTPQGQEYSMGYFKRAPSGFLGMRGKKQNYYGEEYEKRAPSGFLGMRGKKEYDLSDDGYDIFDEKRAPAGFMGMRGKKDYDPYFEEVKRATGANFFGMRGKKLPNRSTFFGMRGKKYPYEFRGKFVGVRGKKMSNEVTGPDYTNQNLDEQLQSLGNDLDLNQLMLLLTENEAMNVPLRDGVTPQQHIQN